MFSFKNSLISLFGLLVLVGTLAALMPLVTRGQGGNPLTRDTRRSFYLTPNGHNGSEALSACGSGYHMASLWEILEPSNLKYNTELGRTAADSGFGPPANQSGWARTGAVASTSDFALLANCDAWMSASDMASGTVISLSTTGTTTVGVWHAVIQSCNVDFNVWCVQD